MRERRANDSTSSLRIARGLALAPALFVLGLVALAPTSAAAQPVVDAPPECAETMGGLEGDACIVRCWGNATDDACANVCDVLHGTPSAPSWCGSLCTPGSPRVDAPMCSDVPVPRFEGPMFYVSVAAGLTAILYDQYDGVLSIVPTFGARVTSSLSLIARAWLGPAGFGVHEANTAHYVTELGLGLGVDVHLFDVFQSGSRRGAIDLSLVAGPWLAGCDDRTCTWTPAMVSAQLGLSPFLIPNAATSGYAGLPMFGIEGGAGYDVEHGHAVGRIGLYVGVDLSLY